MCRVRGRGRWRGASVIFFSPLSISDKKAAHCDSSFVRCVCVCSECLGFLGSGRGGLPSPGASLAPCQQPEFQQAGGAFHFEVGSEAASGRTPP